MTTPRVRVTHADHIAHVLLNRGEKRNGLDLEMFEQLTAAGEALKEDSSVRAVVLSGDGPSFCAGLDMKAFMSVPDAPKRLLQRPEGKPANLAQQVAWVWSEVPVPVIAAIHGHCFGGGLQIALGADIRYAASDAQLSVMEIELGLIPDMSASKTLLRLVRPDIARELVYTGRIVSGDEAQRLGLVTRSVANPVEVAFETARVIASKNPDAIRSDKVLFQQAPDLDTAAAFKLESELQVKILGTPNQMEAAMARMQKRPPKFT